jgi:hypothetical protein
MRDLARQNVAKINDGVSGDVHEIYYRAPTNEERAAYLNGAVKRSGKKLISKVFETRIRFGTAIITGFKKGTIGIDGKEFSSDPNDPDYREDWKNQLVSQAGDIVAAVAVCAFEATAVDQSEVESPLDE